MSQTIRFAMMVMFFVCLSTLGQAEETLDPSLAYRVNPPAGQLMAVPKDEIKLGHIYKYFNPKLSRHVWGIAIEGGRFQYAFGPGSMQSVDQFDLRLSDTQRKKIVSEEAPALSRGIAGTGREVFIQLDTNDSWQIYLASSIPKVFDQRTGRRWEWHGSRRVAVLHTQGPFWTWENGSYLPVAIVYQ